MQNKLFIRTAIISTLFLLITCFSVYAVSFTEIRIGDIDGFGYVTTTGLIDTNKNPADTDGDGLLEPGEFLPDLDGDGTCQTYRNDDFDNRLNETITGTGCTIKSGSTGELFTDISLSTSYDNSSANNNVYNSNTNSYGAGGAFPAPPSTTLSNQPGFVFDFFVAGSDIINGTSLFFNLIFGDYDVTPANVTFTRLNGSTFTQALTTQPGPQDGLIQAASPPLGFSDVFTATAGGYDGYLKVDFIAPNEPYTAFDYVEIGTSSIVDPVPEPSTWLLLLFGLIGIVGIKKKVS